MNTLPAKDIKWGERARSDYGDVEALSKSINKYGLLHPVVIDGDNNTLIAGGRRLTAMILLGWQDIPILFIKDLSKLEKNEVELEENIQRKDLTWQETVRLKEKLHELKVSLYGEDWTVEDTAKSLGESERNTQRDLALAKDLNKFPELEKESDKRIARTNARRKNEIETRRVTTQNREESVDEELCDGLHHGDCRQFLKDIKTNSIDLILCDPPFGIEFDDKDRNKAYSTTYGDFQDSANAVIELLVSIMGDLYRVMKPGGHMYLFYGTQHYALVTQAIDRRFYEYDEKTKKGKKFYSNIPLLWIKSSQQNMSPYTRFSCNYESFIFCWKPGAPIHELTKPHNATFHYEPNKKGDRHHPAQKPHELYSDLISLSSHEGELVLDPFMGSGISLKTALEMNRRIIGIEQHDEWFELAKWNISRANEEER